MSFLQILDYNLKEEIEHGVYVSRLAGETASQMGLDEEMQNDVRIAGLLHDIGKLQLTGYINGHEADPLVIEQMKYVRMHPMLSFDIVKERGYSLKIQNYVRWHHENYDGSGYPDMLKGKVIPLGARIIRVCDVFAALTSDRPYRSRFSKEDAFELMIEEVNHYDMQVFLAFQRVLHADEGINSFPVKLPGNGEEVAKND